MFLGGKRSTESSGALLSHHRYICFRSVNISQIFLNISRLCTWTLNPYTLQIIKTELSNLRDIIIHLPFSEQIVSKTSPLNLLKKIATPAECLDPWLKTDKSPDWVFQKFTSVTGMSFFLGKKKRTWASVCLAKRNMAFLLMASRMTRTFKEINLKLPNLWPAVTKGN